MRVSGREYSGMRKSPCYENGDMTCLSCHVLHKPADDPRPMKEWANDQLKLGMDGPPACTQCHPEYEDEEKVAAHTHHKPTSTGSDCYNCHMPYTVSGLLKSIRSHQVDNPTVQATVESGRPNACNHCHLDKTLAWSARYLAEWYDTPEPELSEDERTIAASVLWALRGDAGLRTLTANYMGWRAARQASGSEWLTPYLALLMNDEYHAVRYIAERAMRLQGGVDTGDYDFFAEAEERYESTRPAFDYWTRGGGRREPNPELLIEEGGALNMDTFNRLLGQRDQTPITLNE